MKYPALDVSGVDGDFLLALVDDFGPSAVDAHDSIITIFFSNTTGRDEARQAITRTHPDALVRPREVDDEDWARRSQESLKPITVGRITVAPPWALPVSGAQPPGPMLPPPASYTQPAVSGLRPPISIVITPSMGFGTGHHATTRLCLRALQELDLSGCRALDAGTGSGVLAIAASRLGADEVVGIDDDRDAIHAAIENLERNTGVNHVSFVVGDLRTSPLSRADVITANLTGALLVRSAQLLLETLEPGGSLVVSGLQIHERDDVVRAFGRARIVWEAAEDEWAAIIFRL